MRLPFIRRYFPRARFVHMVRDGRDVACSLRRQPWMKERYRLAPDAAARCAAYWHDRAKMGHKAQQNGLASIEIRYEDLVLQPEPTLRRLFDFLDVAWDDRVLRGEARDPDPSAGILFATSIGRWRTELTQLELEQVETITGELLTALGYGGAGADSRPAASVRPATIQADLEHVPVNLNRDVL